ncbi:MAG: helix-turn-helix transcriptional regulator [Bifidobacteriaceae bacterium]|jgi:predicted transcriptional regulator|nr:helix-turn-helix transcriptional regulator [Bifidobacteriaceae bacterium]
MNNQTMTPAPPGNLPDGAKRYRVSQKQVQIHQDPPVKQAKGGKNMALLRNELGHVLRANRLRQQRTLREVSAAARVSLGYLSEVERGQKEASSELLASICDALGLPLWTTLREVSNRLESHGSNWVPDSPDQLFEDELAGVR